ASPVEAKLCEGEEVALVGGGNSARQAVVFLAPKVKHLHLVVRGEGLELSMSHYLIERIDALPNVTLHTHTEVIALEGDEATGLTGATFRDRRKGPRKPACYVICSSSLAPIRMPNGSSIASRLTTRALW